MTLLKGSDTNSREINVALLSLEADIKNKISGFDTSAIDKQLAEINSRIDKINAGSNNSSAVINDIRYEIEDINSKLNGNSAKIKNIEQKLSDIFSAESKVTDFNATTDSGIYYWVTDAANRPSDYGVLLVNKYDGGNNTNSLWINQVAYGTNSKIYFRQNINSGNWTEWKAVAFDGEGTADHANAPTGFEIYPNQPWGNQDGVFITDWRTVQYDDINNNGDIAFRFNNGQVNVLIDGVFYQNEGRYRLVDENSLKAIMKPNYTTGKFPAGVYSVGATVYINATITTTRGNPVFISYSGDFNSPDSGSTAPWVCFELYADGVLLQRTSVDDSAADVSDNTSFAGSALAVLSAGSHTIKLAASLIGGAGGRIQFQEQDNLVNLVAFEL